MSTHVLIVDDSLAETRFFKTLLENEGFEVSTACNGKEGIQVARSVRPDAIIMDVVMPLLNGFQATRELRRHEETKDIPVIMCSSKSAATDRVWAIRQGAREYLIKPVKSQALLDALKEVLHEAGRQKHGDPV